MLEESVAQFLVIQRDKPFEPGVSDCSLDLADWAVWLGLPDPAANFRGAYSDEAGFRAIIAERGGLVAIVDGEAASIGGRRIEQPLAGAVGVIGSRSASELQWGAIFDGRHWISRVGEGGSLAPLTARVLTMWALTAEYFSG